MPLVPSEVVLVEELCSFGCLWQEALRFNDVPNQDLANIVAELLSVELQIFVCDEVCPTLLGEALELASSDLSDVLLTNFFFSLLFA